MPDWNRIMLLMCAVLQLVLIVSLVSVQLLRSTKGTISEQKAIVFVVVLNAMILCIAGRAAVAVISWL